MLHLAPEIHWKQGVVQHARSTTMSYNVPGTAVLRAPPVGSLFSFPFIALFLFFSFFLASCQVYWITDVFFFLILRRMGKNKALAHHTSTYFHITNVPLYYSLRSALHNQATVLLVYICDAYLSRRSRPQSFVSPGEGMEVRTDTDTG